MGMFAFLSTQTLIIVLVVALIVFGPQKLPDIGRQLGSAMRELRKMSGDMQRALDLDGHTSSYDYYNSSRYDSASSYSYTPPSDTPLDQYGLDHPVPQALEAAVSSDESNESEASAEASQDEKPKRKRTRKLDAAVESSDSASVLGSDDIASGPEGEPKPRRSRRKSTETALSSTEPSEASVVEPKPTRNRKRTAGVTSDSDTVELSAMVADGPEGESVSTPVA